MIYQGSKARLSKHLLPLMLKNRQPGQWWVEPFVGGGNMIMNVTGNRIGADINKYTIQALKLIRDNIELIPKNNTEFTEADYLALRDGGYEHPLKGYAGFALARNGLWGRSFRKDSIGKRDYVAEAYRNAVKQHQKIQGVLLKCCNYNELSIPENSIIYCDPPYHGTYGYGVKFDHDEFWDWCRNMSQWHDIFISESNAPADFDCIFSRDGVSSLAFETKPNKRCERLFTI